MTPLCFTGGQPAALQPTDRGLAYGDGLFETMAAAGGHIRRLELHLARLAEGCGRLELPMPDRDWLAATLMSAARTGERLVVKLIVTRGPGQRGYRPPASPAPTVVVTTAPWPEGIRRQARNGIRVTTLRLKLGENPNLAGIKHLCRLEQVLAQLELQGGEAEEGLLLSTSGWVVGGISCNVFAVFGSNLRTPRLTRSGVSGIMRRVVMERASELDLEMDEADITLAELRDADELFVTNTLTGIRPIVGLDERAYPIGPRTRELQTSLEGSQ